MEFEVINLKETNPFPRSEILSLWEENGIHDKNKLTDVVLGVKHLSTNKIIAVSTAILKFNKPLNGYYYHYGIEASSNYGNRPLLLNRTFEYLISNGSRKAKGLAAIVVNPDITDEVLFRNGFLKVELNPDITSRLFYKNF